MTFCFFWKTDCLTAGCWVHSTVCNSVDSFCWTVGSCRSKVDSRETRAFSPVAYWMVAIALLILTSQLVRLYPFEWYSVSEKANSAALSFHPTKAKAFYPSSQRTWTVRFLQRAATAYCIAHFCLPCTEVAFRLVFLILLISPVFPLECY